MISYAQNFEDVVLHRVFRGQKDGFYIDIGAMDPVFDSVTKAFYDEGWSGINIEPNEWFYNKLLEGRPRDINLNLAVGEREESRNFYVFERFGNSTFEESSRNRFADQGHAVKQKVVRVTTLAAICRDYVRRPIDFLKIDCEGWEPFVLRGADWDRFRPIVLVVEATAPGTSTPAWSEWEPALVENARYDMVYFDGLNRFYLRREYSDLRCRFGPPNIFDGFKPHGTAAAEQARRVAEEAKHVLQQERNGVLERAAELEETLKRTTAENQQLTESLHEKEAELRCARMSLETAEQARQALQQEQDSLEARVTELDAQAARDQDRIAELQRECQHLDQMLLKMRLWVGRLSQDLAASKRRS